MNNFSKIIMIATICISIVIYATILMWPVWRGSRLINKRYKLLHDADAVALKDGCNYIWKVKMPAPNHSIAISADDPSLPAIIVSLHAHAITIYSNGVTIEMGGADNHFGIETYIIGMPSDDTRMSWKSMLPSQEIVPGLWYYAESGRIFRE
jgi:hypothetical protein